MFFVVVVFGVVDDDGDDDDLPTDAGTCTLGGSIFMLIMTMENSPVCGYRGAVEEVLVVMVKIETAIFLVVNLIVAVRNS